MVVVVARVVDVVDVVVAFNRKLEQPASANAKTSTAMADVASKMDLVDFTANRYLLCVFQEV